MKEYTMYMGRDTRELFDATLECQINPSEENKTKLKEIQVKISNQVQNNHNKNVELFIGLYGQNTFDFIKSISKGTFLAAKQPPFTLHWNIREDYDEDEYWEVLFFKGEFSYRLQTASGYGETKTLESNISPARVLELLNYLNTKELD